MNDKTTESKKKVESVDFDSDFRILSVNEKREVLKTAKTYLKLLKDNALLGDTSLPKSEDEKQSLE